MKDIITVISFTMKDMMSRKAFIISTIIMIILIIVGINVPNIINVINGEEKDENAKIILVDSQNIFENNLEVLNEFKLGYTFKISNEDLNFEDIKKMIEDEDIDEAMILNKEENGMINIKYIVENLAFVRRGT